MVERGAGARAGRFDAVVIGAGPAGLMAAQALAEGGATVDVYDAMPSAGRKFLLAGRGGMNLTHAEAYGDFVTRYGSGRTGLQPMLDAFGPDAVRAWAADLGIATFVGTSNRVFPTDMKAAPLLRAWLHRLREMGVRFHMRQRWTGWSAAGLVLAAAAGETTIAPAVAILALGGGSWARLGSDGAWAPVLAAEGVAVAPLAPANCGFDVAWSEHFSSRHAGEPLTTVAVTLDGVRRQGQFVVTAGGVEGSLIYAVSAALRERIAADGSAVLELDLAPDWALERVTAELSRPRGSRSLSSHLQSRLGFKGLRTALLRECLGAQACQDPVRLAQGVKRLPLRLLRPRPIDEAISSAGGVRFAALDGLMLKARPGVLVAGEMLDWEAPTGGYLLTACLASGRAAGRQALDWLAARAALI